MLVADATVCCGGSGDAISSCGLDLWVRNQKHCNKGIATDLEQ